KVGESASACKGPCASIWPAVTTTGTPTIAGVTGTVGTIASPSGAKQVTLNGRPLYTYAADQKPGNTTGQGFGGVWWVVSSSGAKVTSAPASTPSDTTTAPAGNGY
ncbi:MAG: hypothetical protein HIU81_13555, partial [Acidobacteria bacterium]|nr:hypothetical protein [Acidobacteriota bacterium]